MEKCDEARTKTSSYHLNQEDSTLLSQPVDIKRLSPYLRLKPRPTREQFPAATQLQWGQFGQINRA